MREIIGYFTIVLLVVLPIAGVGYLRYRAMQNKRAHRRARADLTGITRVNGRD